jgi:hypothetical protein
VELAFNYLTANTKKSKTDDADTRALAKSKAKTQRIAEARGLLGLINEMELNNSDGTRDDLIKDQGPQGESHQSGTGHLCGLKADAELSATSCCYY